MNEMMKTAINTLVLTETGRAIGKVRGRRNWVIRMEMKDRKAYVGGMGVMDKRGLMSEFLVMMEKHGTTWAEYTYKKDFLTAVKALEEIGFNIYWMD